MHENDKTLENIHAKFGSFSSTMKDQLSFNRTLETQLAKFGSAIPVHPTISHREKVNAVTTRGGSSTRDPPHPNPTSKNTTFDVVEEETPKVQKGQNEDISHEFYNNEVLSFPTRNHKPSVDEQLKKFVEII